MNSIYITCTLVIFCFFLLIYILYLLFNQTLHVSSYSISDSKVPNSFNNYKIVHLSDLHNKSFGLNQHQLISIINKLSPDLIVMTGDMIDKKLTDFKNTESLFKGVSNIAPVIAVSGNHEIETPDIDSKICDLYKKHNITHLINKSITLEKNNESIYIYGIGYTGVIDETFDKIDSLLKTIIQPAPNNKFSILLNHRSDTFDNVYKYNYSLVLSGHAHGGIIRLPLIGGVISNNRTLFPKYDNGLYKKGNSSLIVSRGLGQSNKLPRLLNRPDIVFITLQAQTTE